MYNTIIFDLDGTLLNTIEDLADSVNYMQRKYGLKEDSVDTVRQHVGNGLRLLVERSVPDGQDNPQFEEMFKCQKGLLSGTLSDKNMCISWNYGVIKRIT